jgi:hypothetical protein
MRTATNDSAAVIAVEALMLEKFRLEPFHNLHLLYGRMPSSPDQGGTCSDKTLSFLNAASEAGFDASLHSAFIGGEEIHRLARLHINGRIFFADVGNGWPALKLYPADREISFGCFGMGFRTEIAGQRVSVFHRVNGREYRQLEIDVNGRPESEIRAEVATRFSSGVVYPFSNSLRFSLVVDDRFLFLRGERLEIHSDGGVEVVDGIDAAQMSATILGHFRYDIAPLLH